MITLFILLPLYITSSSINSPKYIEFPNIRATDYLAFNISLGIPYQHYIGIINTNQNISFLSNFRFNSTKSTSCKFLKSLPTVIDLIHYETLQYSDSFCKPNLFNINNYTFRIFDSDSDFPSWNEGLAFGLTFTDTSFSIIDLLYQQNIISSKSFGFIFNSTSKETNASFYMGSIPLYKLSYYKYKTTLNVKPLQISWNTLIRKISFHNTLGNGDITVEKYASINSAQYYDILNNEIFELFCKVTMKTFLQSKQCERVDAERRSYVRCDNNTIPHLLGQITITFENNILVTMNISSLFSCLGNFCFGGIGADNTKKGTFEIGYNFLKLFNASEFNYEQNQITIYSDTFPFISKTYISLHNITSLYMYIMICCFLMIILLLVVKIKNNI